MHQQLDEFLSCSPPMNLPMASFSLNKADEEGLNPSMRKQPKYDLILILTDLSSANAKQDLEHYSNFAATHFRGVKAISVGTKQDIEFEGNASLIQIETSAKNGHGFEAFEEALLDSLNLHHTKKAVGKRASF